MEPSLIWAKFNPSLINAPVVGAFIRGTAITPSFAQKELDAGFKEQMRLNTGICKFIYTSGTYDSFFSFCELTLSIYLNIRLESSVSKIIAVMSVTMVMDKLVFDHFIFTSICDISGSDTIQFINAFGFCKRPMAPP